MTSILKFSIIVSTFLLYPYFGQAQDIPITLVYTNNTNGNIIECDCEDLPFGGLARKKTVFDDCRKRNNRTIIVDAGDFLDQFGSRPEQDDLVIQIYEKLGYDAVNIGDNELANGHRFFESRLLSSRIPLISSTIKDQKNEPVARPYILRNIDNMKVAFIGYTPKTSFHFFPSWKELSVKIDNERNALRKVLREVSNQADMIIVLSNAGDDEDNELAKAFPEIDVIAGGHSQVELEEPVVVGKTIIVQAGGNGAYAGRLDLIFSKSEKKCRILSNRLIPLDKKVNENEDIKKIVDDFLSNTKRR